MTTCVRCSALAQEQHHPSGRINGVYLDPNFVVGLCANDHRGEHAIRAALGIDKAAPASLVEVVEVALRRVAVTLGRFDGPVWLARLAEACRRWADLLARFTSTLDAALPIWREAIATNTLEVHP